MEHYIVFHEDCSQDEQRRTRRLDTKEPLPNLLLIDGGRPQINAAHKAVKKLGLENQLDLVALAKKEEEIYFIGSHSTLKLAYADPALQLLQRIRDESHRFALRLQRKRRKYDIK